MNKLRDKNFRRGFTIIELITVLAIIGAMGFMATPVLLGMTRDANLSVILNDTEVISDNIEIVKHKSSQDQWPIKDEEIEIDEDILNSIIQYTEDSSLTSTDFKRVDASRLDNPVNLSKFNLDDYAVLIKEGHPFNGFVFFTKFIPEDSVRIKYVYKDKYDTNLSLRYDFEKQFNIEGDIVKDISGQGHDGDMVGIILATSGSNYAVMFDGEDGFINAGYNDIHNLTSDGEYSYMFWMYANSTGDVQYLLSKRNPCDNAGAFSIFLDENGKIRYESYSDLPPNTGVFYRTSVMPIIPNKWTHVAVVRSMEDGNMTMYIDGQLETYADEIPKMGGTNIISPVLIGAADGIPGTCVNNSLESTSNHFEGMMDEVRIYNRKISKDEIVNIMNNTRP